MLRRRLDSGDAAIDGLRCNQAGLGLTVTNRDREPWFVLWPEVEIDRPTARTFERLGGYLRDPFVEVDVPLPEPALAYLADQGFLYLQGLLDSGVCADLVGRLDRLVEHEHQVRGGVSVPGNGYYVRDLIYKDAAFFPFFAWEPMLALARAMLGPKVQARVDSRVATVGEAGVGVPWHVHYPASTDPPPAWFSPPHSLHLLVYLDDIGVAEGALDVLPGSHRTPRPPRETDIAGAVSLRPAAGDCVAMHGNLWHKTVPTHPDAGPRHVLFVGYTAAWVISDSRAGGQPAPSPSRRVDPASLWSGDRIELEELLGEFKW